MTEQFSKDELVMPEWLDKEFFQRALRSFKRDASIKVKSFESFPGSKPGEHFASIMFKVTINYTSSNTQNGEDSSIKVILKTTPQEEGFKKELLKDNDEAFITEAKMYTTVLPEIERILRIAGDSTVFNPTLVYQNMHSEHAPVIVFEDISPDGFKTFDDGISNWEQVQLIVQKLAKFHATSMYIHENGFPLDSFHEHYWTKSIEKEDSMMGKFIKPAFDNLINGMKTWDGFEKYVKKLEGRCDEVFKQLVEVLTKPINFSVLNHGDFHAKNMMYRNDGLVDEDIVFVDYQFSCWKTPALDFAFIFNLLVDDRLANKHRHDIHRVYYDEFRQTLVKINYKGHIPSMLELMVAILHGSPIELMYAFFTMPPRMFNWRDMDMEKMMEDGPDAYADIGSKIHQLPEYRKFVQDQFERLELTGVLDF